MNPINWDYWFNLKIWQWGKWITGIAILLFIVLCIKYGWLDQSPKELYDKLRIMR